MIGFPFDSIDLIENRKRLRRQLLADGSSRIKKKIAILGGSTTNDIKNMLELFLLDNGIEPSFYQSEYNRFWQDGVFSNKELDEFHPDLIFIHTTNKNIESYNFNLKLSAEEAEQNIENEFSRYKMMWEAVSERFSCPIIQNNFDQPTSRILGNKDFSDIHGFVYFINRLNMMFAEYAGKAKNFYIHDINWLSAQFGLDRWADPLHWHMYKYALSMEAIPVFAYSLSNIIKSLYGKNKKALALDLDNTLWGGVVGDDGVNGIEIGQETPTSQAYLAFQSYLSKLKDIGITLTVVSKNDEENAVAGLNHPDGVLKPDDFTIIKANWEPKHLNIEEICSELNILTDSVVFLDDNPAEREIVKGMLPTTAVPSFDGVENYIRILDRAGYFEVTALSDDDLKRNEMYKANFERANMQKKFENYKDYLLSLDMKAVIEGFVPIYYERITQLTNKSNQFNLTTKRYTAAEIEAAANDNNKITLYGKLVDKFGDNGVVSVVIAETNPQEKNVLDIKLWLMSCRVLKRDMELAMLDELVLQAKKKGINKLKGYYYKTAKNNMVSNLYGDFGFKRISLLENGDSVWELDISDYKNKNHVIDVN